MLTKMINVGRVPIGGGAKIAVQSMTNTKTQDTEKTIAQINALAFSGCDIVRVAVPDREAADALRVIKRASPIPIVADIHFDYRLAVLSAENGADKIRINPGNLGGDDKLREIARACSEHGIPIRVGVNSGSLEKNLLEKYGAVPEALCESALRSVARLGDMGFYDTCVSIKSSDVRSTVKAYRLFAQKSDRPLHIGVTEAGTEYMGVVKSAAGIGALLLDGIGDTLRVSLTADPVREIKAAKAILRAVGLSDEGADIISCPTCGRTQIDLIRLTEQTEAALKHISSGVTVAVMGCAVNGPGEARHADYGIAGGADEGVLFRKGEVIGKYPQNELLSALLGIMAEDNIC